jgi:hypothetical protein
MDGLCGSRRYRIRAGALKALTSLKAQMRVSVLVAPTLTFQTWSARCQAAISTSRRSVASISSSQESSASRFTDRSRSRNDTPSTLDNASCFDLDLYEQDAQLRIRGSQPPAATPSERRKAGLRRISEEMPEGDEHRRLIEARGRCIRTDENRLTERSREAIGV